MTLAVTYLTTCVNRSQITVYPADNTPKPMRVVSKARWGHDQNTVLTGSADGFLRVFDVRTGEKVQKVKDILFARDVRHVEDKWVLLHMVWYFPSPLEYIMS